jgi:TRAP-type mannitol/chloroaromatic compound transport system permease large subunit
MPLADLNIRIVNTQDIMQAMLLPAAAVLAGWFIITAWMSPRQLDNTAALPLRRREAVTLAVVPLTITVLLTLVTLGYVRAVEAAALAGSLLLLWGVVSRRLTGALLWQVLDDAMALTGALFALLVAATTFSLVLRGLHTDELVGELMRSLQGHPTAATVAALVVLLSCATVLDAFELVFLIVPIVMPPLLSQVGDAAWVAVLTLLVLQAGFLLPPFGYAVMLSRGQLNPRPPLMEMARVLRPYLAWLACVAAAVLLWPQTTLWLRSVPIQLDAGQGLANDEVERMMRAMSGRPDEAASSTGR